MCSIGHHDGPDVPAKKVGERPPRRHTDGSVTRQVAKMPRKALAEAKAKKTAELRAAVEAAEADALAAQHGVSEQLELIPPVMAERLPLPVRGLPPADSLYYSTAREA